MRIHSFLTALLLAGATLVAAAQSPAPTPAPAPTTACPAPEAMVATQLYGLWQLSLWTEGGSAAQPASTGAVRFERHPEYPGSVRGQIQRHGAGNDTPALVSGDVIDGEFNLDESRDGTQIDAVWTGAPTNCGREVRGLRRPAEGRPGAEPVMNFLLKKPPGWG